MAKQNEGKPGRGWLTRQILSELCDTTTDNFDRSLRRYAPPDAVKIVGKRVYIHGRKWIEGWLAAEAEKRGPTSSDPMLTSESGDSPGLERYRNAKADLTEIDRDERRSNVFRRELLEPVLTRYALVMRRAGERLARQFGNDAAAILNEAVDEWEDGCTKALTGDGTSGDSATDAKAGDGDEDAAPAVNARVRRR